MSELDDISAPLAPQAPAPSNPMDEFSAPLARPVAQQKAVLSVNDNGEEAARALQIGKRTGIPASVVQSDLPGYDAHERQQSAVRAVQNPYIAKYVETSKHGAAISGDDYDKLDEASQALQALHPELVRGKAQAGLFQAVPEIAEMLTHAPGREKLYSALKELPAALGKGILDFFETPGKVASGEINLTTPLGLDQGISFGIGVALGSRDIRVGRGADTGAKLDSPASVDDFLARVRGAKTRAEIDEFLASKQPGPPGAMLQIEHARVANEALDKAVEVAQESKTKVRSPETFAEFGAAHDVPTKSIAQAENKIHIDAAKIMELYQKEGKIPAEGDGLLGFVSGLAERAQSAAATGGEVTLPMSQYIAYIDPSVHEKLRESVRLSGSEVTLEEAKEVEKTIKTESPKETLVGAAIKVGDEIFAGEIHALALEKALEKYPDFKPQASDHGGFLTSTGRYIRRNEATEIAKAANQIKLDSAMLHNGTVIDATSVNYTEQDIYKEKKNLALDNSVFMNMLFRDSKSIGITDAEFKKYSDKIANQEQAILDKAVAIGKREASKRLTPEWRANEERVRQKVEKEITQSPTYLADRYFNFDKGMLPNGKRILSDFFESQDLASADSWAPIFGFETGSEMSSAMVAREAARKESGKGANWQLKQEVAAEVAARMEAQYGDLAENIAKEAREIALADHTFDVLAEEVRILARASGTEPPLNRGEMVSWAKKSFEARNIADAVNWDKHRRAVEKGGREAEKALLKGDFREAFDAKQRQFLAAIWAKESLALDNIVNKIEAKIDRFSSEEVIKGIDQTYLEQIRQMLASVGVEQQFAPLQGTGPLRDFVADSEGQLSVAPWLTDGSAPAIKDMSVAEFRAFVDSMKSLEHVGRKAAQLENSHGKAELQNVIFDIKKELDRFDLIKQTLNPSIKQRANATGRFITAAHLLVEKMLDYTDKFDPNGPLTSWLDRPLRDSNTKEIQLTEQVTKKLRVLKQYTDSSINELIPQKIIFDKLTGTWLNMDRGNLRQLAMYMGARENIIKVSEGLGANEADVRRLLDQNMTEKDWKWVQGMWDIYADLHKEAAEMVMRDTGVPLGQKISVPLTTNFGEVSGGYAPLIYDRARSNIEGTIAAKNPTFEPEYFTPLTAHGYTQELTQYSGFLDLTGIQTAPKIQTMIHDIAFREAIRNASKLINNEEFMAVMTQKWSKEYAGLLPGWLRDIANVRNIDDAYAVGAARVMAGLRQNITSALIAFNPGTYMKHGGTAAAMSVRQVGAVNLAAAAQDLGIRSIWENARDLVQSTDARPTPEFIDALQEITDQGMKGEAARQFILASSAVMRNRQRKAADSVRGAYEIASEAGPLQTAKNLRHLAMNFGRIPVAITDTISAMPTWLAAYKKAVLEGSEHTDAVFIADKEMSRAHGSNFVGDKPRVMRTGEIMRWVTPLYNFWNHNFNNHLQLAWDAAARIEGRAEPGADWARISHAMFWISVVPIIVHELAAPPKDEHGDKIGVQILKAVAQHYGSMIIGLRDISNAALNGYDPSIGTVGTVMNILKNTGRDIKNTTAGKQARDGITHSLTLLGALTGVGGQTPGKIAQFGVDVLRERDRPQNATDIRQGLRTGHSKARKLH